MLAHSCSVAALHFVRSSSQGGPDIGDPGYRAIPGFSWQLQEVTATFLAHCPTAVRWHMSPYSWASCRGGKVSDICNRYWKQQNKRSETKDKNQSCDIIALGNFFLRKRGEQYRAWRYPVLYSQRGQHLHNECTHSRTKICVVPNVVLLQLSMPLVQSWTHWRKNNGTLLGGSALNERGAAWGSVLPLPCLHRRKQCMVPANHMGN